MSIKEERMSLIREIQQIDDVSLLKAIKAMLNNYRNSDRVTLEQYNKEMDEAEARVARGEYLTHDEAIKLIRKYRS